MRKLLFALIALMVMVGCGKEDDSVEPVKKQASIKRLSKIYKVDFLVHSNNGGTIDIKVPSTLVLDESLSNDTTGGKLFKLDFEYSFESDLINAVWMDCSKLIPRNTNEYYVASIFVDGVVVASDSIYGSNGFGWGTHLEYVIEK